MPSSLVSGPLFRALRVSRILTIVSGGILNVDSGARLRLVGQTAPANPVLGDMYVTTAGVLMIYNGTAWVSVGSQV